MSVTVPWKASGDSPVDGVAAKLDDVRDSLSKEAERLAKIADSYTRDARRQAADIGDEASLQAKRIVRDTGGDASKAANEQMTRANSWMNDLIKGAASLGTAIALSGRKTAQDLGDNAQSVAKDLRRVRITTEPQKTGPDFMPGISLLAGFGAGIALMYFLDPERGRARRNLLRDKLMSWSRKATDTARGTAKDLSNRTQGAIAETNRQLKGQMMSSDVDPTSETQTWRTSTSDTSDYTTSGWPEESQPEEISG